MKNTLLLVVLAGLTVIFLANRTEQATLASFANPRPAPRKLIPEEFVVKSGEIRYWTFKVSGRVHVFGSFHASGGANDIEAFAAEWSECENLINGHQAHVQYSSGKVTNGKLDLHLQGNGDDFCIAFSNRMALLTPKEVSASIMVE